MSDPILIEIKSHLVRSLAILENPMTLTVAKDLVRSIQMASAMATTLECIMRGVPPRPPERE